MKKNASDLPAPEGATARTRRKRRGLRRLVGVLIILTIFYLLRAPILRTVARLLIAEDSIATTDFMLILDSDQSCARAGQLYHAGFAQRMLVIERKPGRLERLGVRSSFANQIRQELFMQGVPEKALTVIQGQAFTDWDNARCLKDWLRQRDRVHVALLCERFSSRRMRFIFNKILGPEYANQVSLLAVAQSDYDETNWWRNRQGKVDFFEAYVGLGYVWLCGEDTEARYEWDPEAYEMSLKRAL